MKRILFTTTMIVGFFSFNNAQSGVGIGTNNPVATLDVTGTAASATTVDGVIVPRLTAAELQAKDAVYTASQNGTLVFVTSGAGGSVKTAAVTGAGFYYYDSTSSTWKAVGGSSSAVSYQNIRGTVTTTAAATYTVLATDYLIVTTGTGTAITFPALTAAEAGRTLYVFNNNSSATANSFVNLVGATTMNQLRGYPVVWSGSTWFALTK